MEFRKACSNSVKVCLNRYNWGAGKKRRAASLALIMKMFCATLCVNQNKNAGRKLPKVKHECYAKLSVKSFLNRLCYACLPIYHIPEMLTIWPPVNLISGLSRPQATPLQKVVNKLWEQRCLCFRYNEFFLIAKFILYFFYFVYCSDWTFYKNRV